MNKFTDLAGLYIHIPFCSQACFYCDFHFSVNLQPLPGMVKALSKEIELRTGYLRGQPIDTIYLGGGTPSLLTEDQLAGLLESVFRNHTVEPGVEVTMEANPDDLTPAKLGAIRRLGINRLSIGIQSFDDATLRYLNRVHDAKMGLQSLVGAREAGFENISIDLIYAVPEQAPGRWEKDLEQAIHFGPEHLSCYGLTIEKRTVFGIRQSRGELTEVSEDIAADEYQAMSRQLGAEGYTHYEISNFARPERISRHNSNYWRQIPYIGIGPGAHSFDLRSRQHNVSGNHKYLDQIGEGIVPCEIEILTDRNRINEILLTGLRTMWGVDLNSLKENFNYDLVEESGETIDKYCGLGLLRMNDDHLYLKPDGELVADKISEDLFAV